MNGKQGNYDPSMNDSGDPGLLIVHSIDFNTEETAMNSAKESDRGSTDTGRDATDFEEWTERFRNSLKEKQESMERLSAALEEEEKTGNKYDKSLFFIMAFVGVVVAVLFLLRIL
ncbi:MAG: hypothetical protein P8013_12125 [Candidatus Sulfobium sp.]|jgi:septin family protein